MDIQEKALSLNAIAHGTFALVSLIAPRLWISLTHNGVEDLDKEVFAILRGWGAACVAIAFICHSMKCVASPVARKAVFQGCLLYAAAVFSGQWYTLKYDTHWNVPAGYLLLVFWGVLAAVNGYFGFYHHFHQGPNDKSL